MFFDWNKINNNDILDYYKKLTSLKKEYIALESGSVSVEVISNGVVKIVRSFSFHNFEAYVNVSGSDFEVKSKSEVLFSHNCESDGYKNLIKN